MKIDEKLIDQLAVLTRLSLTDDERVRFAGELQQLINHFADLQSLDTEGVPIANGGTALTDMFREDDEYERGLAADRAIRAFPEHENGFLKVPPVFGQ